MKEYICIDIGGTSIKHGVVREDGTFAVTGEMPTQAMEYGGPGIMEKAKKIVEVYREEYQPEGICISTAGMVDCEKGKITYAAPLIPNYTGTEIKKTLEDLYGIPCEVENDVNCAGLAEHFAGASKGSSISLCLTIGTGIGGAIIIDGKECREADWTRIFDVGEDGAFYMGDYVCSDKGGLKEIRFDKVYLSEDQKKKRK